ncbi:Zn-ribbon domain-containing OB-fold protein [Gordonia sp. NPDC058843]|uniref:Zn-ribbon domain-containing OB-fold protein n=1 Tax=Gordonia sp. NPDC058843 TaxID=3346648 RepID=UPI0036751BCF
MSAPGSDSSTGLGGDVGLRPVTDDPETGGLFAAAADRRLVVQTCRHCEHQQHPPRPRCRACHGDDLGWTDVPQDGTVHTWTVVEHQINPRYPVPYTSILVDVEPRPGEPVIRFLGHIAGRPDMQVGTPVRTVFVDLDDSTTIPNWELIPESETTR